MEIVQNSTTTLHKKNKKRKQKTTIRVHVIFCLRKFDIVRFSEHEKVG